MHLSPSHCRKVSFYPNYYSTSYIDTHRNLIALSILLRNDHTSKTKSQTLVWLLANFLLPFANVALLNPLGYQFQRSDDLQLDKHVRLNQLGYP